MTSSDTSKVPEETPIQTLERLATLARIAIPESQKETLAAEFEAVRTYIGQLDQLDIDLSKAPVAPLLHNVSRNDGNPYKVGNWTDAIVAAFPAREGSALSVKKIISHE